MEILKVERNSEKHCTRFTHADGTHEDFKTVRGSIVFPVQKTPGVILVGGVCKEADAVKILEEKEFNHYGVAASELLNLEKRFLVYKFYYQDIPEAKGPINYLQKKTDRSVLMSSTQHCEDFEYGVRLIDEYLSTNRLSVPKNGIIANQLLINWEDLNTGNRPHAVIALSCLLTSLTSYSKDGVFITEGALEACTAYVDDT